MQMMTELQIPGQTKATWTSQCHRKPENKKVKVAY